MLAIATNIPVLLETGFVVQGHILMTYSAWKYSRSLNPIQYLNWTTNLLTINKQQIRSLLREHSEYVFSKGRTYFYMLHF